MHLESFDVCSVVYDELKEEFIDGLKVRPGWISECFFFFHADSLSG